LPQGRAALPATQSDLRFSKGKKQGPLETNEKTARDLSNTQEELGVSKARLRDTEEQVAQFNRAMGGFREEIQLKTAQHAGAQSLMNSMRDQISEMAMKIKKAQRAL
jgi:predicted  nucleic acid-binding Zn-ribbon protein